MIPATKMQKVLNIFYVNINKHICSNSWIKGTGTFTLKATLERRLGGKNIFIRGSVNQKS